MCMFRIGSVEPTIEYEIFYRPVKKTYALMTERNHFIIDKNLTNKRGGVESWLYIIFKSSVGGGGGVIKTTFAMGTLEDIYALFSPRILFFNRPMSTDTNRITLMYIPKFDHDIFINRLYIWVSTYS